MRKPLRDQRPTSVTVFGFIHIGYGLLGLLLAVLPNICLARGILPPRDLIFGAALTEWAMVRDITMFLFSSLLVVAGVGLLEQRRWAWKASLVYGVYGVLKSLAGFVVFLVIAMPQASDEARQFAAHKIGVGMAPGAAEAAGATMVYLIYPGCILYFMARRSFGALFEEAGAGPER